MQLDEDIKVIRSMLLPPFRHITRWQAAEMLGVSNSGFDKITKNGYKARDGLVYYPEKEGTNYTFESVAIIMAKKK